MVAVLNDATKESGNGVQVVEDNVDVAVVEQVPEGCASGGDYIGQAAARGRRHFLKFLAIDIAKKERTLRPSGAPLGLVGDGINVSIGDENIEPAVVVEIEKARSPAEKRDRGHAKADLEADIG